jgi:hypothetical protein
LYGEIYDEEDTFTKKKKIACCWTEYRKYGLYNDLKKDNLEAGLTLVELLNN